MVDHCSEQDVKDEFIADLPTEFTTAKIEDLITKYSTYVDEHTGYTATDNLKELAVAKLVAAHLAKRVYPDGTMATAYKADADDLLDKAKAAHMGDVFTSQK